ncbi:FAD-dependent oxidoreductase [Flavobacterium johnsoniae]|uniref:FAD-dependent oxidoreductase n=1 Tax=Flavobacterium TaxID=237 RepID=UPI0023E3A6FD|nr:MULTISPECIES: FAD-dependent oxidoreductase [Flavobacterium]WET04053.1 FAD-dependent oxidoreductase [Flavobacterium sp. YJ01]WJS94540.1 FAD-dependent oxidoreductase [Flavobacterium johnsoniae]
MQVESFSSKVRSNKITTIQSDLVVVGGGLAGVCAAIAAAREGVTVTLVQDRPVLGGNASSEVRLWTLGATSHMGNNNRWAREGGIIDEILVENLYRNKEGNALIFDTVLLEKVSNEKNLTLLLNTAVYEVEKADTKNISQVTAFCSQNSTTYILKSNLFCDASGDGIVGFQAGAAFRMGAEKVEEFGEKFAPDQSYGELLGHTIYFYSKDTGAPVKYVAPEFALKDITEIPRYKSLSDKDSGCRLWWLEYGGRKDTIHESEDIKWELWKVVYGVWDYIKNSGEFPDAANLTLEWVGTIPGKRESRRFEGHYMIKQQDLIEQNTFEDAVSFGGWAVDLHPSDGVYDSRPGCTQYHSKGVYQIPLRTMISQNIENLFLSGRIISATHVAFGSTRVMATCAHAAQAVGYGAAQCVKNNLKPAQLLISDNLKELQQTLSINGQSIPGIAIDKTQNLLKQATIQASSTLKLNQIDFDGEYTSLEVAVAQLLPFKAHQNYGFKVKVKAQEATMLTVQLRTSSKARNYTPDIILETIEIKINPGEQEVAFEFKTATTENQYAFVTFLSNDKLSIQSSTKRYTGVLSVFNGQNKAVNNNGKQTPPDNIGIDAFEFWIPFRRPKGQNIAMQIEPTIACFGVENLTNGFVRPYGSANAWLADLTDTKPTLKVEWETEVALSEIKLFLDPDYDHPMESTLMGHPEEVVPFCVQNYTIKDRSGKVLFEKKNNCQAINTWTFDSKITTKGFSIELEQSHSNVPVAVFEIFCQ